MALGDAKSGPDVDPTLGPASRLAFRRPGRQTHGAHRTQGIIFADEQYERSEKEYKHTRGMYSISNENCDYRFFSIVSINSRSDTWKRGTETYVK